MIKLRPYQNQSVDNILSHWMNGGDHSLIVLPTGTGKSLVAAELMRRLVQDYDSHVLLATHVAKLVSQNAKALLKLWPDAPYGIYHAGLGKRDGDAPICFAGIHSIFRTPSVVGKRHVLIIDEAHLLSHKDEGMYRKLINHFVDTVPGFRVGGLTATAYRMGSGNLTEDYGDHKALFEEIVFELPIIDAISQKYLLPVIPYASKEKLDVTGVKVSAGDYNKKELQERVDVEDVNARIAADVVGVMNRTNRMSGITFCAGVRHAEHMAQLYREHGLTAVAITKDTSEKEKERAYDAAERGEINMLCGMNTLTTGIDIPRLNIIACVRPTKSKGLWVQMLGRGTRLCPETGKKDCMLLDYTNNSLEIGPLDLLSGRKEKGAVGTPPVRECPECGFVHHISAKHCPMCNVAYPPHMLRVTDKSRGGALLSNQEQPLWYDVDNITYSRHTRPGKNDSLRIDYHCGMRIVSEWMALEHETSFGWARKNWERNSFSGVAPESVAEALENIEDLRTPGRICVVREGKFDKVVDRDYSVPPGKVVVVERPTVRVHRLGSF